MASAFPLVGDLGRVENRFLQVLLDRFELRSNGPGFELGVEFSDKTRAIWSTDGKRHVRDNVMAQFARDSERYQRELDEILVHRTAPPRVFSDPAFPFRYVSGGTLPLIRMPDGNEYYCCFYRPVDPIGWNLANGGSDNLNELKNPILALERELREELVLLNPRRKQLYTFAWDEAVNLNVADFAEARGLLSRLSRAFDFVNWEQITVPLLWLEGPDVLRVRYEDNDLPPIRDCFLNINAIDFGIEVDRIAWMEVGEGALLCDGDLSRGRLLNRLIGLFEIHSMHQELGAGSQRFIPERFYHNLKEYKGYEKADFEAIVRTELRPTIRGTDDEEDWEAAEALPNQWDLCPVTRRLLSRCVKSIDSWPKRKPNPRADSYEVFLCYSGADRDLATRVRDHMENHLKVRTFFGEQIRPGADWLRTISAALNGAEVFLAVASDPRRLRTTYPMFECLTFHVHLEEGLQNKEMIPVVVGGDPKLLPNVLKQHHAIVVQDEVSVYKKLDEWWISR